VFGKNDDRTLSAIGQISFWLIATLTPGIALPVNCCDVPCVQTDGAVHM
jgi:hypothetical protein